MSLEAAAAVILPAILEPGVAPEKRGANRLFIIPT
jgi:hypothetical protein